VGIGVEVLVGVGGGESPWVLVIIGVKETHRIGVGVPVDINVAVEVYVRVKVKLGEILTSIIVAVGEDVCVKKRSANACWVSDRSRGVAVADSLGDRTISSCVSGLPPASMTGRLNARTQAPTITKRTIAPCAFTLLVLLPYTNLRDGDCQIAGRLVHRSQL
jgi:hypothetical protein